VTIVYALLAALGNALNVITQHTASVSAPKKRSGGWRFVVYLAHNRLWLLGWIALIGAFVFQALALHVGLISVVQPLLVTELVFTLALRRLWLRQAIRPVTWWAAAGTCASLGVFLGTSEPHGGHAFPASHIWLVPGAVTAGLAVLLTLLGMRGSPVRRAALLACATAIMWAIVAALIKATTYTLAEFGVGGMFERWPVYALAVAGAGTEILAQVTLHAGPLSVSQPFLVIVDPIVSIALSVAIFGEYFTENAVRLTLASAAFAGMCCAAAALIRTAPATIAPAKEPQRHNDSS
jgi:hypothetical protein